MFVSIRLLARTCAIAGVLTIVGCSTQPQAPQRPAPVIEKPAVTKPAEPVVVQPQPGVVPTPATPPVQTLNPAALSLARQAHSQYLQQDYQGAIATAERGLRIERRAADLYLVLAQAYAQLGLSQKADMFAQQGLRFAPQGSEVAEKLLRVREFMGN
ncbi:hypothetical protein [Cellvibrio sp. pealriver]|uniref:hypothetical protein n=1 Tax=Cellvibrio sp. pealriver TaxID=1622269 RepID=UPI00066FF7A8|nr:hypothetical protein [Cellvibrio sp. pealriver]